MKKILFLLVFSCISFLAYSQIYKRVCFLDRNDNILKRGEYITKIYQTDTTFIIDDKKEGTTIYYILDRVQNITIGNRNYVVDLGNNVLGYQEGWCVVKYDKLPEYNELYKKYMSGSYEVTVRNLQKYWIMVVKRTITSRDKVEINSLFWLEDFLNKDRLGKDVNRIIYFKE